MRSISVRWSALVIIAASLHAIVTCGLMLVYPFQRVVFPEPQMLSASLASSAYGQEVLSDEVEYDDELVAEELVLRDEPATRRERLIVAAAETDDDLPYQESFGSSDASLRGPGGLSDAPFAGPVSNGTVGVGGGAGGAFRGRGGGRDLGTGGGGRRRECSASTWKQSPLVPHTTKITVGDNETIPLEGMHVTVRIEGFRARVLLDCLYRNDKRRSGLEGDFQIRLPNGATPYYFAFGEMTRRAPLPALAPKGGFSTDLSAILMERSDSWAQPREARMVSRVEAARSYQETVRQKVDPALLEWSGADIFRAHVSPLAAGRLHRVVLGYEVDLRFTPCFREFQLQLPSDIPDLVVDLHTSHPRAQVTPAGVAKDGHIRFWNPPQRAFTVRLPGGGPFLMRGRDEATGAYLAARFRPRLPVEPARQSPRAVFLVDGSLSADPQGYRIWLALLRQILERNRAQLRAFSVGFFDVDTIYWRDAFVANTPENVAALMQYAEARTLRGATDLHSALRSVGRHAGAYDVFLLSDGAATWNEDDDEVITSALPSGHVLFAYQTGLPGTDVARLRALVARAGGGVFSVPGPEHVAQAARAHAARPWRLLEVSVPGGSDLLLAGKPVHLYPGQALLLVGRGHPPADAAVTLTIARGGVRRRVVTPLRRTVDSDLTPRIYGQVAVGQLEMFEDSDEEVRRAYATHFRVVGKTCSLLMLEREADYKARGIVPMDAIAVVRARGAQEIVASAQGVRMRAKLAPEDRFLRRLRSIQKGAQVAQPFPPALEEALAEWDGSGFSIRPRRLRSESSENLSREVSGVTSSGQATVAAEQLAAAGHAGEALLVLSGLVERAPADVARLRDIAFQAQAWGYGAHAFYLLRRAATLRPFETQSLADMGACLAATGQGDAALLCYEAALSQRASQRSPDLRRCVLFAYVHLLARMERGDVVTTLSGYAHKRFRTLRHELGVHSADLVVAIGWSTDRTDVDLHVKEPGGEVCYYKNRVTKAGGRMTHDVTTGFGPEAYVMQLAQPGTYEISARLFRGDRQRTSSRTRVWATIYENWGRGDARAYRRNILLAASSDQQTLLTVTRGK